MWDEPDPHGISARGNAADASNAGNAGDAGDGSHGGDAGNRGDVPSAGDPGDAGDGTERRTGGDDGNRVEGAAMNDPSHTDPNRHDSVWLLLPWYANGSLAAAERRDVEEHLGACARCRAELEHCQSFGAALRAEPDHAPSPHPIQLARLMARIEASEQGAYATAPAGPSRRARGSRPALLGAAAADDGTDADFMHGYVDPMADPDPSQSFGAARARRGPAWRRAQLAATPRAVRMVLVGQLAAMLLLGVALVLRLPGASGVAGTPGTPGELRPAAGTLAAATQQASATGRQPLFHTLSAPATAVSSASAVPRQQIRVVFSETATERQIRDVLLQVRGRLTDGPSPLGTYTLEVAAAPSSASPGSRAPRGAGQVPTTGTTGSLGSTGAPGAAELAGPGDTLGCVLAFLHAQPVVRFAEPIAGATAGAAPSGDP
jgi:Putative zinc-finger